MNKTKTYRAGAEILCWYVFFNGVYIMLLDSPLFVAALRDQFRDLTKMIVYLDSAGFAGILCAGYSFIK